MTNKQHNQNQNQKRAGGAQGMAQKKTVGRRDFLKYAGMATAAAGSVGTAAWAGGVIRPDRALAQVAPDYDLYFGGTDGWIWMPETPALGSKHPDDISPAYNGDGTFDPNKPNTYIFGFRNLTGMTEVQANNQKFKAQHMAPLFWVKQYDDAHPANEFKVAVTNLGLELRPDLFDAHTLHWHGFRNVIPFFDGEPSGSVAIPSSRVFTYAYRAREEGTYMYHCHVEDTEHVHMGMTGLVFVRPLQEETNPGLGGFTKYLYNDGNGSTGFDREYAMFLSEIWVESHWADSHVELPEWSDYRADFAMLNGRTYPETLLPNASIDPANPVFDADGDLVPMPGHEKLQYQPYSSLVRCNAGESVALRFANLGFKEAAMTLSGIPMRVVGRDATFLKGRDGTDGSYLTDTINLNAGESFDVLIEAPAYDAGTAIADGNGGSYNRYFLYNRNSIRSNNLAPGGFGGQATEVHVYPANYLADQTLPNAWGTPAA